MNGRVKFFNNAKGWGIIETEEDKSFFVHHSDIDDERFYPIGKPVKFRTLSPGQLVSFQIHLSDKKYLSAKQVKIEGETND